MSIWGLHYSLNMGSVCCTSARAGDMTEVSEGWSMEQAVHTNHRIRYGALSPPPLSSRWEQKSHFSEIAAGHNCMCFHRTSSSSSRICRSNSNGSERRANSSHRHPDRADGLLAIFNSPSESFHYSQRSFDHSADSVAIPVEPVLRRSAAYSNQEESGLSTASVSFGSASQKALEDSDCVLTDKQVHTFSKRGLSASNTCAHPRQIIDPSLSFEGSSKNGKMLLGLDSYQHMMKNSVEMPLGYSKQKSGSWKIRGFSELVESSRPGSSRWSSLGISSNISADGDHEDSNEFYIRSTGAMHHHDICAASQVEVHNCGLCAKAISQKSLWSFSRVLGSKDMPVVGVLDCGHVYHAECLDQATPLMQAHDPPCPKCEDREKVQSKVQGQSHDVLKTIGLMERSSVKWKLSRVGVSTEDFVDVEPSKSYQPVWNHCGLSESFSKRGASSSIQLAHGAERSFSAKSLLKKQFSFRGKLSREATSSSLGSKRPGYPARVSPENNIRENDTVENWIKVH